MLQDKRPGSLPPDFVPKDFPGKNLVSVFVALAIIVVVPVSLYYMYIAVCDLLLHSLPFSVALVNFGVPAVVAFITVIGAGWYMVTFETDGSSSKNV